MSRYELRDISERLSRSADAEAVAYEFLGAMQSAHPTWRMTLAFYEISRDALVKLYEREKEQFRYRDIKVMVDQLPPRMIRNFFHPNMPLDSRGRQPGLAAVPVHTAPVFEPDLNDAVLLRALLPVATWQSAVCLPLQDKGEMLAILTIVSPRRGDFSPKVIDEIAPLKSMAAFALAERLHLATRSAHEPDPAAATQAMDEFRERVEQLGVHARELEQDNAAKAFELARLTKQLEQMSNDANPDRAELERMKSALADVQATTTRTAEGYSQASQQLEAARTRLEDIRNTQDFLRGVFDALAEEHDPRAFPGRVVKSLMELFGVGRCSVMLLDRTGHVLRVAEQSGIPPEIAEKVRVRLGQGVAGWVAEHRKPLFVRHASDNADIARNADETYNTESFICVPIVYNGRCAGVLSLSNRWDGRTFEDADLERAVLAAGVFAITLGANEVVRRALAWAA